MRDVPADSTDRKKMNKDFRERKSNQDKIKDERFAKIEKRRKAGRDGKGSGINVEVTGDN
jgi:hypothetical protein